MKLFILIYVLSLNIFADRIYASAFLSLSSEYSKKSKKNKKTNRNTPDLQYVHQNIKMLMLAIKTFPLEHIKINNVDSKKNFAIEKISINKQEIYFHFTEEKSRGYVKLSLSSYTIFIDSAIEIKTGVKLTFKNRNDFLDFRKIFQHLVSLVNLREVMMSAVILVERCGKGKHWLAIKEDFNDTKEEELCSFYDMESVLDLSFLNKMLSFFSVNYSVYKPLENSRYSETDFLEFAKNFLNLLATNPNLLFYIEIETLVNIIKKIYLEFSHVEIIHNKIKEFFLKNSRGFLLYLRGKSESSGESLYKYIKKRNITHSGFCKILREESDVIWLSFIRNLFTEDRVNRNSKVNDFYNYEELMLVSQVKIMQAAYLFSLSFPDSWQKEVEFLLSENIEKLQSGKDFSSPYGRWAQAGAVLIKYKEAKEKTVRVQLVSKQFEEYVFNKIYHAESYLEAIKLLSSSKFIDTNVFEIIRSSLK
jgi:hypothetical protein